MKKTGIMVLTMALSSILPGWAAAASSGEISVRYLANEGVMVRDGKTCVVVDFPFAGKYDWCVSPSETQIQALLERKPPFESVDAFLFTHDHRDHFDPVLTAKALEAHPRAVLVGTTLVLNRVREAGGNRLKNLFLEAKEGSSLEAAGMKILTLNAPHAPYWDIDPATGKEVVKKDGYVHRAYLVSLTETSFFHGGDAYEIAFPEKASSDYILFDRGILRAKGLEYLTDLHRRMGARRTALIHVGPAEIAPLKARVEKESAWLTVCAERDQIFSAFPVSPKKDEDLGLKPELYLPGVISGPAHDYVVRFDPEMKELYLMRSGLDYHTAILRYRFKDGRWGEPELAPIPFSGSISYPFLSPDGSRLFFGAAEAGSAPDFWSAVREGDGWGRAANLGPNVNSPAVEMLCSVAANGNIYFDSNRPGGQGGFDLYRAVKTPNGYAPAENLGPAVNSTEFDAHPFIAPDESFLLFDSRRPGGQGGNDLYVSFRKSDGTWAPALNLGPEINTASGDMRAYVSPDGKTLYFCSDRSLNDPGAKPASLEEFNRRINGPGNGSQDIWRVSIDVLKRLRDENRSADKNLAENLKILKPLANTAWQGTMKALDGKTELVCDMDWQVIQDGQAVRFTNATKALNSTSEGLIYWDPDKKAVAFIEVSNKGNTLHGLVTTENGNVIMSGTLVFPKMTVEFRNVFEITSDGRLLDKYFRLDKGQWLPGHTKEFRPIR